METGNFVISIQALCSPALCYFIPFPERIQRSWHWLSLGWQMSQKKRIQYQSVKLWPTLIGWQAMIFIMWGFCNWKNRLTWNPWLHQHVSWTKQTWCMISRTVGFQAGLCWRVSRNLMDITLGAGWVLSWYTDLNCIGKGAGFGTRIGLTAF